METVNGAIATLSVFIAGMQVEEGISGPEPATPTGTTPSLGSWTTSLWSTPTKEEGLEESSHNQSAGKTGSQPADADSFWSSFFDSPSKKQSFTSPPSAMKKPPSTPTSGSTPKSHVQGKRESGQKVLNRKETKTSAKSPRRLLQTASESKGGEGEPPLSHPPKVSGRDTQEAGTLQQEASQPSPVGKAPVTGTVPLQPTPTDTTSLEESGKEAPFSGGWQSQPLLSVDTVQGATTQGGTVSEMSESKVRVARDKCSSDKDEIVGTSGALTDFSVAVSEAVGQVDASGMEEEERNVVSPTEEQPQEVVLIQLDQAHGPGLEGAGILPSDEQGVREGDEWDGGWLERTSPPPDVIPQGGTPEELPNTVVEYEQDVVDKLSTPSESSQPGVSEGTDIINAPAPDHVLQHALPDCGSAEEGQVSKDGAGLSQAMGHSPLPVAAELPSLEEGLSAVKPGSSGDDQPSEEFQRREESQRQDGFEEERPHTSAHDEETPNRETTEEDHGNLLGEGQPLDGQVPSSPEGHKGEQEAEFMTPAAVLPPPATTGSWPDLETQLRNVQEVCVYVTRLMCRQSVQCDLEVT